MWRYEPNTLLNADCLPVMREIPDKFFQLAIVDPPYGIGNDGQKKKVLIAKSLCQRAHLYVWDEPLNFIDIYSRMQIEQLIQAFSLTMVFVEHDGAFREAAATKAVPLRKSRQD